MNLTSKNSITVLIYLNRISAYYSLHPLLTHYPDTFKIVQDHNYCLKNDKNKHLIILRYFEKNKPGPNQLNMDLLEKLANKYEKIVWFDDGDGAGTAHFEVLPYVVKYFKKQLFKDKKLYLKSRYGRELFTEYYHKNFNQVDEHPNERVPIKNELDLEKLAVAWNIGIGSYPIVPYKLKMGILLGRKLSPKFIMPFSSSPSKVSNFDFAQKANKVHARFSVVKKRATVGFQRKTLLQKLTDHKDVMTGRIPPKAYNTEMKNIAAVLSPFGWGEITFRDFEAIQNGAILIKPDMSHIDTFPNVFVNDSSYLPISWGFENTESVIQDCIDNMAQHQNRATAAYELYQDEKSKLKAQVEKLIAAFD